MALVNSCPNVRWVIDTSSMIRWNCFARWVSSSRMRVLTDSRLLSSSSALYLATTAFNTCTAAAVVVVVSAVFGDVIVVVIVDWVGGGEGD